MAKDIEIKSSLLNDPDFSGVKDSIIAVSQEDGKQDFRVKMIEYINDSSSTNNDMFFYDMLEFSRFLNPGSDAVAYTTPDKLIYMNAPGQIGESARKWDFIYDHECLHQLWDTFGVEAKINKEKGSCDHMIMNIASDCVINDYLSFYRKKEIPSEGLVTPEYIKKAFDVDYDRAKDTQYTLYLKLFEKKDKVKNDPLCQDASKQIDPKEVREQDVPGGGGPQGEGEKHSDDYIKGWKDGINDVTSGKVDPTKFTPKKVKSDYDQGYNDVMAKIKKGVEEGIDIPKGGKSQGNAPKSDLPQIPWKTPQKDSQNGSSGDQDKKDQKSGKSGKDGDNKDNDKQNDSSEKSKPKNAKEAQDAADEAKKSAKEAQDAADEAKAKAKAASGDNKKELEDKAKEAQDAADDARKAARDAQDAADKAKKASKSGDKKGEEKAAEEAGEQRDRAADDAQKAKDQNGETGDENKSNDSSREPGKETADVSYSDADLKKIKERAEKVIEKYKNKISGDFGKFISQCKASVELKPSGLAVSTQKGVASWKESMDQQVNAFVKKKIFQKKREWQSTYSRVKRGSGFVKFGEPIEPGRKIKEEKLTINAAFYVDRSGSMESQGPKGKTCLDYALDAAYLIAEGLKKKYSKDVVVDSVSFKMYAFDTVMHEVKWGQRVNGGGGTMSFEEIMDNIDKKTKDFMINIIITDAGFSVNQAEVSKFVENLGGMLVFVTNYASPDVKKIADKHKTNMSYIEAPQDFRF